MVKADHLEAERGMIWRVVCESPDHQSLGTTEPVVGTSDWRQFSMMFVVPSNDCRAQWLRLELDARNPIEQQVAGAVWYDGLTLTRSAVDLAAH
jgi:hypothetical protein